MVESKENYYGDLVSERIKFFILYGFDVVQHQ